jgi:hypothetical protein
MRIFHEFINKISEYTHYSITSQLLDQLEKLNNNKVTIIAYVFIDDKTVDFFELPKSKTIPEHFNCLHHYTHLTINKRFRKYEFIHYITEELYFNNCVLVLLDTAPYCADGTLLEQCNSPGYTTCAQQSMMCINRTSTVAKGFGDQCTYGDNTCSGTSLEGYHPLCKCDITPTPPTPAPSKQCTNESNRTYLVNVINSQLTRAITDPPAANTINYSICYIESTSFAASYELLYNNCRDDDNVCYTNTDISHAIINKAPHALVYSNECTNFKDDINKLATNITSCTNSFNKIYGQCELSNKVTFTWSIPGSKDQLPECPFTDICNNICRHKNPLDDTIINDINKFCNIQEEASCNSVTLKNKFYEDKEGRRYLIKNTVIPCKYDNNVCHINKCQSIPDDKYGKLYPTCYKNSTSNDCVKNLGLDLSQSLFDIFSEISHQYKNFVNNNPNNLDWPHSIGSDKSILQIKTPLNVSSRQSVNNLLHTKIGDVSNAWWLSSGLQLDVDINSLDSNEFSTMYQYLFNLFQNFLDYKTRYGDKAYASLWDLFTVSGETKSLTHLKYIPGIVQNSLHMQKYILQILIDTTPFTTYLNFFGDSTLSKWNFNVRDPTILIEANLNDWQNSFTNQPYGYNDYIDYQKNSMIPNSGSKPTTQGIPILFNNKENPTNPWGLLDSSNSSYRSIRHLINNNNNYEKLIKFQNSSWSVDISMYNTFQKYLLEDYFNNFDKGVTYFKDDSTFYDASSNIINDWFGSGTASDDTLKIFNEIFVSTKYGLYRNSSVFRDKCKPQVAQCSITFKTMNSCILPLGKETKHTPANVFFNCAGRDYNSLISLLKGYIYGVKQIIEGANGKTINHLNQLLLTDWSTGWFRKIYPIWYWNDTSSVSWGSARKNESDEVLSTVSGPAGMPQKIPPPPPLIIVKNSNTDKYELSLNRYDINDNSYTPYTKHIRDYIELSYNYLLPKVSNGYYKLEYINDSNEPATIKWKKNNPFNELLHYWVSVLVPACQGVIDYDAKMNNDIRSCLNSKKTLLLQYAISDYSAQYTFTRYNPSIYQCDNCLNSFEASYNKMDPSFGLFAMAKYSTFMMNLFDGSFATGISEDLIITSMKGDFGGTESSIFNDISSLFKFAKSARYKNISSLREFKDLSGGWISWFNTKSTLIPPNHHKETTHKRIEYDSTNEYLKQFNIISQKYYTSIYQSEQITNGFDDYLDTIIPNPYGLKFGILTKDNSYILPPTLYLNVPGCVYGMLENYRTNEINKLDNAIIHASVTNIPSPTSNQNEWHNYILLISDRLKEFPQYTSTLIQSPIKDISSTELYKSLYGSVCRRTDLLKPHHPQLLTYIARGGGGGINDISTNPLKIYSNLQSIETLIDDISNNNNNIKYDVDDMLGKNIIMSIPFDSTIFNINKYINIFISNYVHKNYTSTLSDIQLLFYLQLIPLLKFKYGLLLVDLYTKSLNQVIVTYTDNINSLRTGIVSSSQLILNKLDNLESKLIKNIGVRSQDMFTYSKNYDPNSTDISYITKYIFSLQSVPTILDTGYTNDISNLDAVFTTYSNSFTLPSYANYIKNKKDIHMLELSYNSYLFKYALTVNKATHPSKAYGKMRNYYKFASDIDILTNIMVEADISMSHNFDKYLASPGSPHLKYRDLYSDLSTIYFNVNNDISGYSKKISDISKELTTAINETSGVSNNCNTACHSIAANATEEGVCQMLATQPDCCYNFSCKWHETDVPSICRPLMQHTRLGIWFDVGKYSPVYLNSKHWTDGWKTISQFLLKNGVHNYNLAFSQLNIIMLCVYAKYITELESSAEINTQFNILVAKLNNPLENNLAKDTIFGLFNPSVEPSQVETETNYLMKYYKGYTTYKNGFIQLKKAITTYDPSAIIGVALGGENASKEDNFLYDEALTDTMTTDNNISTYTLIKKIALYYKELIYGVSGETDDGCDTCDYDLENAGFWTTSETNISTLHWYQFLFFNEVKQCLQNDPRTLTQKLTLLGDPTTVDTIYNLISNGVYCFDAINIMGYGDGTTWYISASPTVDNNPVSFNSQAWLNVISAEWIDISDGANFESKDKTVVSYITRWEKLYKSEELYNNLIAIFHDIHVNEQSIDPIKKYLKKHDISFVGDETHPGLADKLIMNYQDNTNYYDFNKNNNDKPWARSVNQRVKEWFGHDISRGNTNTVGREAWYINFMWWVDTLTWATNKLEKPLTAEQIKYKLQYCSEGVHFWIDENRNSNPDITKLNTSTINLFTTYQILQDKLFTGDISNLWLDSSKTWVDISNTIMKHIRLGNDSNSTVVCTDWRCKSFMWGTDNSSLSWVERNIKVSTADLNKKKFQDKIIGGWSNTNQEGTWDSSLGCNTLCLGNFGASTDNFGAGPAQIPSKFGTDTNVLTKINHYKNIWYTIGGEDQNAISFGDQAFTRMSIDIGGYWSATTDSNGSFNTPEWSKQSGFSSSWENEKLTTQHQNNKELLNWTKFSDLETYTEKHSIEWIMKVLTKDICYNGICFDAEATGQGPPWWQKGEYTDPFIRALGYNYWSDMDIGGAGMGTFQVYIARRWINMWRHRIIDSTSPEFKFSCAPETGDALSDANLYENMDNPSVKSYLLFNILPNPITNSSSCVKCQNLYYMVYKNMVPNKPFDYLIPQMYNNNLAYKKWDPFTSTSNIVEFGDCDNVTDASFANCQGKKLQWEINVGVSPSDVIKHIADPQKGNWPTQNIILTFESAAAYMYTFDPSIVVDFSKNNGEYSNKILSVSGELGIINGWERECIGTSNTANWTQSFQDSSGIFWEKLMELIFDPTEKLKREWNAEAKYAGVLGWPAQEERGQTFPAVDGINIMKMLNKLNKPTPAPTPS